MITTRIIKAAEKAVPFEKKLTAFFSKKAPRLITLGALAVVFSLIFYKTPQQGDYHLGDISTLPIYLAITAAALFFSSISRFTMMKFIIADIAVTAVHFLWFYVFATGSIDFTVDNAFGVLMMWCLKFAAITYIPALILSLLTGLIITRKKTSEPV